MTTWTSPSGSSPPSDLRKASPRSCVEAIEPIAAADGSTGWAAAIGFGSNIFAGYLQPDAAAEVYADPDAPNASMFAPMGNAAAAQGAELRLTGRWPFTSNCLHASWIGVGAFFHDGPVRPTSVAHIGMRCYAPTDPVGACEAGASMAASDTSPDAARLLRTRGLRALVDGLVAVVLPGFLLARGFSPAQVGAVVTATLLGSAAVTLTIGLRAGRLDRVHLLQLMAVLMIVTGLAFGMVAAFGLLLVVAAVGTINPSSGDVSAFLPIEQALLPDTVPPAKRTHVFARYTLVASLAGAVGSLAAAAPEWLARHTGLSELDASRGVFFAYALAGLVLLLQYRRLAPHPPVDVAGLGRSGLGRSKAIVLRLSLLFSVDSFGGGFAVQSILVLWLALRHDLSTATAGAVFFWSGLLTASSALMAPRLAARIGLIRTMVFTHLPANGLLMAAALMPDAGLAVACLLARALLSQMDVPARTSYVMAVVDPEERTAAATITNVPRSLASALPPLAAGWMLEHSTFGWPLLLAGSLKIAYDLALLVLFRDVRPPEEVGATA